MFKAIDVDNVKPSARRCLFGPVTDEDRLANDVWLRQKLTDQRRQASEKWGYDFDNDQPFPDENSDFKWYTCQPACHSEPESSGLTSSDQSSAPSCHDVSVLGCDKEFRCSPPRLNRQSLSQPCQKTPNRGDGSGKRRRGSLPDATADHQTQVTDYFAKRRRVEEPSSGVKIQLLRGQSLESSSTPRDGLQMGRL